MSDSDVALRWGHLTDLPEGWRPLAAPQLGVVADLWRNRGKGSLSGRSHSE